MVDRLSLAQRSATAKRQRAASIRRQPRASVAKPVRCQFHTLRRKRQNLLQHNHAAGLGLPDQRVARGSRRTLLGRIARRHRHHGKEAQALIFFLAQRGAVALNGRRS